MAANTIRRSALTACAVLAIGTLTLTACGSSATAGARAGAPAGATSVKPTKDGDLTNLSAPVTRGLDYVALGSSFAAGPSIPPTQSSSGAAECQRSGNNYASIVARDIGAELTDVTCSGATTANILTTDQGSRPPQINAVTSATDLVTITIGGNDINYLGSMTTYSCQNTGGKNCGTVDQNAMNSAIGDIRRRLENVLNAVHARAPRARVLLVSYSSVLPDTGGCTGVPLTRDQRMFERTVSARLAQANIDATNNTHSTLVRFRTGSHGHDACSASPWVEKYRPASGRTSYHPNEAGMKGAASLVEAALR